MIRNPICANTKNVPNHHQPAIYKKYQCVICVDFPLPSWIADTQNQVGLSTINDHWNNVQNPFLSPVYCTAWLIKIPLLDYYNTQYDG